MGDQSTERGSKRPSPRDFWRLLLAIVTVVAVVQELRKPPEERTWQGKVGNFVPYDFRKPTMERVRQTYWNPEGPVMAGKVWGVGWAPNFGALKKRVLGGTSASDSAA